VLHENIASFFLIRFGKIAVVIHRPDGTSSKTFASGAGGIGSIPRVDQIYHTLQTTRHCCNL